MKKFFCTLISLFFITSSCTSSHNSLNTTAQKQKIGPLALAKNQKDTCNPDEGFSAYLKKKGIPVQRTADIYNPFYNIRFDCFRVNDRYCTTMSVLHKGVPLYANLYPTETGSYPHSVFYRDINNAIDPQFSYISGFKGNRRATWEIIELAGNEKLIHHNKSDQLALGWAVAAVCGAESLQYNRQGKIRAYLEPAVHPKRRGACFGL